ncbi:MAG: acetyl-CoA carboxylase biotin carboxyl carrier protein subunit [Clostridiales bacterium]|jgi:glutaconyl-CoA decarboxylase|nr:acetyl-CoA carboxylase biotin carboxyl carrier protein subunit [Clostridiales bacterium]
MRRFNITVDGKAYQVDVEEIFGGAAVSVPATGQTVSVPAQATPAPPQAPVQAAPIAQASASAADGVKINAPLPGMIIALKAQNGAAVKKGQTVLVIEAMKMENDVASPADGVITFAVAAGQNVAQGQLLASVK